MRLDVFSAEGKETSQALIQLPALGRISRLLVELSPETEGQVQGWIRLRASRPMTAQELFGTDALLAAVPAVEQE